jgi:hypothetical protein
MTARNDDPEVTCGCLPIFLTEEDRFKLVDENIQLEVFLEITGRLMGYVEAALKEPDPWKPIRIMAQAERLLGEYIEYNFHLLMPLQRQLQDTVFTAHRMARRFFIKRALTCSKEDQPFFDDYIRAGKLEGPGAVEDYEAVERHLDFGKKLMNGLVRKTRVVAG